MKNIFLLLVIIFSVNSFSQSSDFKLSEEGVQSVVIEVDSLVASDIFNRTNSWIQRSFANPEEVIKAKINNEMIRLEGFQKNFFTRKFTDGDIVGYDVLYELTIDIKDNRYRLTYLPKRISVDGNPVHFTEQSFFNGADINGNAYEGSIESYTASLQDLHNSLLQHINEKNSSANW